MNADFLRYLNDPALVEHAERLAAQAPPLSDRQRAALAELLRPVRRAGSVGGDAA